VSCRFNKHSINVKFLLFNSYSLSYAITVLLWRIHNTGTTGLISLHTRFSSVIIDVAVLQWYCLNSSLPRWKLLLINSQTVFAKSW